MALASRAALALENASLLEESKAAVRARDNLLAVVSHDLKNPLHAIRLATAVLSNRLGTSGRRQLETIQRSVSRMDLLIGDLLDMASIQAGRISIDPRPHLADALGKEALELNEALANEKSISLRTDLGAGDLLVRCDRERILQVFGNLIGNLIGNSVKFCRPGERVVIATRGSGDEVTFTVADTGPGIAEENVPHLFEAYWSEERHAKRGTGLGLYITRGIVEAHGGRIWVESQVGRGTSFHFTLPVAPGGE